MALGGIHVGQPVGTRRELVNARESLAVPFESVPVASESVPVASESVPVASVPVPSESDIWAALAEVPDPEIPTVSVVDLGLVRRVEVTPGAVRVEILPTFVGCPALEAIRHDVAERLSPLAPNVHVDVTFGEPWTTERITPEGRRKLKESGFAPPMPAGQTLVPLLPVARCPYCESRRTVLENPFGPTLCRAIYYCTECRQPFEQFKSV